MPFRELLPKLFSLVMLCCVAWGGWIIFEYALSHPYLTKAITEMPYGSLLSLLGTILLSILAFIYYKRKVKKKNGLEIYVRGIYYPITILLIAVVIISAYTIKTQWAPYHFLENGAFFTMYSAALLLALLVIFSAAYGIGLLIIQPIGLLHDKSKALLSVATGISIIGIILVILGLLGILRPVVLWILFTLIIFWRWKAIGSWLYSLFIQKRKRELHNWWSVSLVYLLLVVTAVNWVGSIKPFPIGFDGIAIYINTTNLISQYNYLPAGGQAFNWSVFMSLGQIMFNSLTISILLSHFMSVLCLWAIYRIARHFLKMPYAILAAAIPYVAPYFGFHSFIDEKVDLAYLFISLSALLLALETVFNTLEPEATPDSTANIKIGKFNISQQLFSWALLGWLCGFAFGIKYTALFLILSLACTSFYKSGQRTGFAGAFLIALGSIFLLRLYTFAYIDITDAAAMFLGAGSSIAGLAVFAFYYRKNYRPFITSLLPFGLMFLFFSLAYLPWAGKNIAENGQLNMQSILNGKPDSPDISIDAKYLADNFHKHKKNPNNKTEPINGIVLLTSNTSERILQKEEQIDLDPMSVGQQAEREEIKRYLGYEPGIWKYLSLPYDLTINSNISKFRFVDIGFLFLLFLPLLLLSPLSNTKTLLRNLGIFVMMAIWTAFCFRSLFYSEPLLEISTILDHFNGTLVEHPSFLEQSFRSLYSILLPAIITLANMLDGIYKAGESLSFSGSLLIMLVLSSGVYFSLSSRLANMSVHLKMLGGFLFVYAFLWWILGNGIVWYGFLLWVLLPIFFVYFFQNSELFLGKSHRRFSSAFYGAVFGIYIICNTFLYFTNPQGSGPNYALYTWTFIKHFSTDPASTKKKVLKYLNPTFDEAIQHLNKDKSAKIYRVNTYLGFHIEQNDQRVYSDPVLGKFDEITRLLKEENDFLNILKDNDFQYILYDLGTAAVDKTPEQSLVKKNNRLLKMLITSRKARLLVTDHYIKDPNAPLITLPNGKQVNARKDINGETIFPGSFVLYKIM